MIYEMYRPPVSQQLWVVYRLLKMFKKQITVHEAPNQTKK